MSQPAVPFSEARHSAATIGCTLFVGLYKAFEQEFGKERALPVLRRCSEAFGHAYGQQLKEKLGGRVPTPAEMAEHMATEVANFGCRMSWEGLPNGVKMHVEACPMSGAYAALGLDHEAGREVCTVFATYMDAVMADDVGWTFELKEYRKDWNGACEEVMTVK
jgi:hypothetical protein